MRVSGLIIKEEHFEVDYTQPRINTELETQQQQQQCSSHSESQWTSDPESNQLVQDLVPVPIPWKIIKREGGTQNNTNRSSDVHTFNIIDDQDDSSSSIQEDQIPIFLIPDSEALVVNSPTPGGSKQNSSSRTHDCSLCGKKFQFNSILIRHQLKCSGPSGPKYFCPQCGDRFMYSVEYQIHMREHRKNTKYDCNTCGKTFKGLGPLNMHKKTHLFSSNSNSAHVPRCDVCFKRFKTPVALVMHRKTHFREKKSLVCKIANCGAVFESGEDLQAHKATAHAHAQEFSCDICGKEVTGPSQLAQHKKTHSRIYNCKFPGCELSFESCDELAGHKLSHKVSYVCPTCGESVLGIREFQIHKKTHDTEQQQFSCKVCNIEFESEQESSAHKAKHAKENYACATCGLTFKGIGPLFNHTKMHTRAKDFECKNCEAKFGSSRELQSHERSAHAQPEVFACTICAKVVSGSGQLTQHMRTHARRKIWICPCGCGESIADSEAKKRNKRKRNEDEDDLNEDFESDDDLDLDLDPSVIVKLHPCPRPNCGDKVFKSVFLLKRHMETTHVIRAVKAASRGQGQSHHGPKPHSCLICGKGFRFACLLSTHMKIHEKPQRIYTCGECGATFDRCLAFRTHKRIHTVDKKFECDICHKVVSGSGQLAQHKKMHDKVRECIFCGKTFKFTCLLLQHLKSHSKPEQEYTCKVCKEKFTELDAYRTHKLSHAGASKEYACPIPNCTAKFTDFVEYRTHKKAHGDLKPFSCTVCGKAFKFACLLRVHTEKVHSGRVGIKYHRSSQFHKSRPGFPCDICGRVLKGASQLIMHKKAHENEKHKIFSCKVCNSNFTNLEELRVHKTEVHGPEGPYICDICGREVSGSSQLTQHKKSHSTIHSCPRCELTFQNATELAEHKKTHRPTTKCEICGENILGIREFQLHKKTHEVQTWDCKICILDFASAEEFEEHKQNAHVANNFACPFPECGLHFKGLSPLYAHVKMHRRVAEAANRTYSCADCPDGATITFKSKGELSEHRKMVHPNAPTPAHEELTCDICSKVVAGANRLAQHKRTHFRAQYNCKKCGTLVTGLSEITKHKRKHKQDKISQRLENSQGGDDIEMLTLDLSSDDSDDDKDNEIEYVPHSSLLECPECGKTFKFQSLLRRHVNSHGRANIGRSRLVGGIRKDWNCSKCPDLVLTSSREYFAHKRQVHYTSTEVECELCGKKFKALAQLVQHKKVHNMTIKTCLECGKVFKWGSLLRMHMKTHTKPQKIYKCVDCDQTFTSSIPFRIHRRIHAQASVGGDCDICGKFIQTPGAMATHKRAHARSEGAAGAESAALSCVFCGKTFKFASLLLNHLKQHSKPEREFPCGKCELVFSTFIEFRRHKKTHAECTCDICGKVLSGTSQLTMHKKSHRSRGFPCDICGRVLKGASQLASHKKAHEAQSGKDLDLGLGLGLGTSKAEFVCDICGKEVTGASQLTQHKKSHSTIHRCPKCDLECPSATELAEHKKIHRVAHKCQECGESVFGLKEFFLHKRSHVKVAYKCKICTLDFTTAEENEEHKKIHIENNFKCDVCGLNFKGFGPLYAHVKMHKRSAETYACDEDGCTDTFKYAHELIEHRKIHKEALDLECKICGRVLAGPSQLAQHTKTHGKKIMKCTIPGCGKTFPYLSQLTLHKNRAHFKKRGRITTHACHTCGKTFKFNYLKVRHEESHHTGSGAQTPRKVLVHFISLLLPFVYKSLTRNGHGQKHRHKCGSCDLNFDHALELRIHTGQAHPGHSPVFSCTSCDSTFNSPKEFMIHKIDHHCHPIANLSQLSTQEQCQVSEQ